MAANRGAVWGAELAMRSFYTENDLMSAEVQEFKQAGCMLHTRSNKYGKLCHGMLVVVPSHLIKVSHGLRPDGCSPYGESLLQL